MMHDHDVNTDAGRKALLEEFRDLAAIPVKWGTRKDGSMWMSIGDPVKGYHVQADWQFGESYARLLSALPAAIAKIAELERANAELRTQMMAMNKIAIELPYGDPITIYQENVIADLKQERTALQQQIAALRAERDEMKTDRDALVKAAARFMLMLERQAGVKLPELDEMRQFLQARAAAGEEGKSG